MTESPEPYGTPKLVPAEGAMPCPKCGRDLGRCHLRDGLVRCPRCKAVMYVMIVAGDSGGSNAPCAPR